VGYHRHTPEIEQVLSRVTGRTHGVVFTPHLVPMDRGILTTAYGRRRQEVSESQLIEALRQTYAATPFVRVVDHLPATKDTAYTNYCDLTARVVGDRAIVISTIDNLIKGASGAAVQNMNLMFGIPETAALD
jgi:N-acetyl-gamma-glutamyl-phosphate reductase